MARKFIGYFRLMEACARPGCPACRCVVEDGRRRLEGLIYAQVNDAQVNDVDTLRRLRAAWGFCNWHTWTLSTVATSKTGSAIIYEDVLCVAAQRVNKLRDRRRPRLKWLRAFIGPARPRLVDRYATRVPCPVCVVSREAETRYIDTAVGFAEDPDLALAYGRSTALCVRHLVQAIDRHPGRPELGLLLDRTTPKWRELCRNLDDFVRKHEYPNTEPISEAEASACETAFEILAGAQGVFGSDLHQDALSGLCTEPPTVSPAEEERDEFDRPALESRVTKLTQQA